MSMKPCTEHPGLPNPVVAGIRRAEQVFYEQVGDRRTLEHGIAFFDVDYPGSAQDNAFREVLVASSDDLPAALADVEAFYASHNLTCRQWVPCLAQAIDMIEPFLTSRGLIPRAFAAMAIGRWPEVQVNTQVRIFPARAMRQAFRGLHEDELVARIEERRLDYAQFDVHVATFEGKPAGRCGLMQAGEIGQICNLFVAPPFRRHGVGRTLVSHAINMARRLMMKVVCCKVSANDADSVSFLQACGFERHGEIVEFHRP